MHAVTKPLPFTQSSLRRAIAAARKEGLTVRGIRPDGTVIVDDGDNGQEDLYQPAPGPSKWEDVGHG